MYGRVVTPLQKGRTMIASHWLRVPALGGIIFSLAVLGSPAAAAAAAGWSPETIIMPSQPSPSLNSFSFTPGGTELWVTSQPVVGGNLVEAAQRSLGGAWSPMATIANFHSGFISSAQSLTASIAAGGIAAAAWSIGGGVQISLRSAAGTWSAPVGFATSGSASNLVERLDAQGNGVATWAQTTATVPVIEAVTWNAAGAFDSVTQVSSSTQGAAQPDLAVNEAGTAVVVWQAFAPNDNGNPNQIESATRPAGGSWSVATAVSPVMSATWTPRVALDSAGAATAVWQQGGINIDVSTRPAGGSWASPVDVETSGWITAGDEAIAADSSGNVTATWVSSQSGSALVRSATRPAGGAFGAPTTLAPCGTQGCSPVLAVARDGSIAVVGFSPAGATSSNVAVRLGQGSWAPMKVGTTALPVGYVAATSGARATAVWIVGIPVKYHNALKQSDFA